MENKEIQTEMVWGRTLKEIRVFHTHLSDTVSVQNTEGTA